MKDQFKVGDSVLYVGPNSDNYGKIGTIIDPKFHGLESWCRVEFGSGDKVVTMYFNLRQPLSSKLIAFTRERQRSGV